MEGLPLQQVFIYHVTQHMLHPYVLVPSSHRALTADLSSHAFLPVILCPLLGQGTGIRAEADGMMVPPPPIGKAPRVDLGQ